MAKVLITRSFEENTVLKKQLEQASIEVIQLDSISYKDLGINYDIIANYNNIIITSKFAAKIIPSTPCDSINAWVVGGVSAKILQAKKYNIKFIASSATDLLNNLPNTIHDKTIYLSGNIITVDMPQDLRRKIIYEVSYNSLLNKELVGAIISGISYIMLYSENCAKNLLALFLKNNLMNYIKNSTIICISDKVAKVFEEYSANIVVLTKQNLMIKFIESDVKKNSNTN